MTQGALCGFAATRLWALEYNASGRRDPIPGLASDLYNLPPLGTSIVLLRDLC